MILQNHFKFIVCICFLYCVILLVIHQCLLYAYTMESFPIFSRQIAFADIIIVNKTDLVTEDSLLELKSRIT